MENKSIAKICVSLIMTLVFFGCNLVQQPDFIPGIYTGTATWTSQEAYGTRTYPQTTGRSTRTITVNADGSLPDNDGATRTLGALTLTMKRTSGKFSNRTYTDNGTVSGTYQGYPFTGTYTSITSQPTDTTLQVTNSINITIPINGVNDSLIYSDSATLTKQ